MRLCARPRCSKRFDLPTCNSTSNGNKSGGTIDNNTESSQILARRVPIRCTEKPQLCGSLNTKVLPPRSLQDHITSIIYNIVHTNKSTPSAVKCDSLRLYGGPTRPWRNVYGFPFYLHMHRSNPIDWKAKICVTRWSCLIQYSSQNWRTG